MKRYRIISAPRSLRRSGVHLNNIALIPAALLPDKEHWQRLANDLPHGDILIVLPWQAKQQSVVRSVALQLREKGKQVRVLTKELPRAGR